MINCKKKQKETRRGETTYRCMHRKSEHHKNTVDDSICGACPVRVWAEPPKQTLPIVDVTEGYPPCEHRASGKCTVTGHEVNKDICNRCYAEVKDHMATFPDKMKNYASAVKKWVAAGRPVRSDERVKEILNDHCRTCRLFDREKQACNSCGCSVNESPFPLGNKLKMATEKCPLGQFDSEV